ncbi:MAG: HEPN domain-containing protein, partial [Oscillospiraceae bacterium]
MSRSYHTTDSKRYFDWLFHAKLDYLATQLLITDERCYLTAAFHCQQCIEKALKGYLLFKNRKLFDGHNLTWLCKQ